MYSFFVFLLIFTFININSFAQGPQGMPRESFVERLDQDGDGKVSKDEFDGPSEHFNAMDKDGDGYLSENEAQTSPPPPPGREGFSRSSNNKR